MATSNFSDLDFPLFDEANKAAIAAALKRYSATRIAAIRPAAMEIMDRDLVEEFDVTGKELESLIGIEAAQEFADYAMANAAEDRSTVASKIPRPSQIVLSRHAIPPEQRLLRSHLAKLIFVSRGVAGISSGFSAKRIKGLAFLPSEPVKLNIQRRCGCPACRLEGDLTIQGPSNHTFRCACGHKEGMGQCQCGYCMAALTELASEVRRVVVERMQAIALLSLRWQDAVQRYAEDSFPSNEWMRRDFELHKNDPGKSLRMVLTMNPTDVADFQNCVEKVAAHGKSGDAVMGEVKRIRKEAKSCKILYEAIVPVPLDSWDFPALIATSRPIREVRREHGIDANHDLVGQIMSLLMQSPTPELGKALHVQPNSITLETNQWKALIYDAKFDHWSLLGAEVELRFINVGYLNPYFLGRAEPAVSTTPASTGDPLFKSQTEAKAFSRICGENPGTLVVPNRLLRQVVGFERLRGLKDLFSSDDIAYLWQCELDFAIYNGTGTLLFVEEVQRGEHHDKAEWIRKDAVKRKALKAAGVILRESF